MLGRHVQRVEAVPLVLDLGPFDDREPHAREDRLPSRSRTTVSGWRWPSGGTRPGSVTSIAPAGARGRLRAVAWYARPARFDGLLQLVGEAADLAFSDQAAPWRSVCIHEATTLFLRPRKRSRTACASRGEAACASSASNAQSARRRPPDREWSWKDSHDHDDTGASCRGREACCDDGQARRRAAAGRLRGRPCACFARLANAAGLAIASSDRLLRSSVTPAFFRPLMNCP